MGSSPRRRREEEWRGKPVCVLLLISLRKRREGRKKEGKEGLNLSISSPLNLILNQTTLKTATAADDRDGAGSGGCSPVIQSSCAGTHSNLQAERKAGLGGGGRRRKRRREEREEKVSCMKKPASCLLVAFLPTSMETSYILPCQHPSVSSMPACSIILLMPVQPSLSLPRLSPLISIPLLSFIIYHLLPSIYSIT